MNQFIKLFLIYPLLLIAAIIIFLSTSVNYIETEKTRVVKVNTFDACREVSDFKSCVLDKHKSLSRFVNCVGDFGKLEKGSYAEIYNRIEQGDLTGCYGGYELDKDSLVHYEKAAELINNLDLFKEFINEPGKLCNDNIKSQFSRKITKSPINAFIGGTSSWRDNYNRCDESGSPAADSRNYTFTHDEDRFLWKELLIFLVFFLPSTLALIFFWRNKSVIAKLLQDQQTYSWLLIKRKFRTALVLSLSWLALFFIVLFSQADFSGFNPFTESGASGLWFVYLFSFYPLMTLLISYFIYSADNE